MTKPKNELEATSEETPFPADLAVEDVVEALVVSLDVLPPVAVVVAPLPVPVECVEVVAVEAVEAVEEEGNKLAGSVTLLHERLYRGVVLNVESLVLLPTRPKLGSGTVGAASWRTYHQVLTLPKADAHPTSSQNVCALATLAMARFSGLLPLTGQPVSVIQTGFPPATEEVALYAAQKRLYASSMLLLTVFWKYGYSSTPNQSTASITALFDEFVQAFQVSTWPIDTPLKGVPDRAFLTCVM
jgi:hypothetical protein